MNQIELHIASSSQFLPLSLFGIEGQIFSFLNDGRIARQEIITCVGYKIIPLLNRTLIVGTTIVKKQSTNPTRFISMGVPKIIVTFLFVRLVKAGIMHITNRLALLMKMHNILIKKKVWCEVNPPAKPLIGDRLIFVVEFKVAKVGMTSWPHRIFGMDAQPDAPGKKMTMFNF